MTRDEALFKENSCSFLVSASDPVNPLSGGRMRAIEVGKWVWGNFWSIEHWKWGKKQNNNNNNSDSLEWMEGRIMEI